MFYLLSSSLIISSSFSFLLFLLLFLLFLLDDDSTVDEKVERHKVGACGGTRERAGKRERRRENVERKRVTGRLREERGRSRRRRRGSSIPEPGLDPRPSPPKSSTAARPQFRFVFSAPLLVPPFFLPSRFSLFFYLSPPPASLFRPFLPDHGDNRAILSSSPPSPSLASPSASPSFLRCVPPARLHGRELWEKRCSPLRDLLRR